MSVKYMEYVKCFFTNEIPGILKFTPKRVNCDIFCKKNWECKIFYSSIFQQKCQFFLQISTKSLQLFHAWKFQWNLKIRRKGEYLALILENYEKNFSEIQMFAEKVNFWR